MPDVSLKTLAREARTALGLDPPELPSGIDVQYATDEELDEMIAAFDRNDMAGLARIVHAVEARRERRELSPATPRATRQLVKATVEARAEGGSVLPVSEDLHVRLAFDPHGGDEEVPLDTGIPERPEPTPEASESEPEETPEVVEPPASPQPPPLPPEPRESRVLTGREWIS